MGLFDFWAHADAVARAVALVLVLMSIVSWSLIFYKSWWLRRVARAQTAALAAFWRGESWAEGAQQAMALDDGGLLGPFLQAARDHAGADTAPLTRHLRAALHAARAHRRRPGQRPEQHRQTNRQQAFRCAAEQPHPAADAQQRSGGEGADDRPFDLGPERLRA